MDLKCQKNFQDMILFRKEHNQFFTITLKFVYIKDYFISKIQSFLKDLFVIIIILFKIIHIYIHFIIYTHFLYIFSVFFISKRFTSLKTFMHTT